MVELHIRILDDEFSRLPDSEAEIYVVEGHLKALIKAADLLENRSLHQHAGRRDGADILHGPKPSKVTVVPSGLEVLHMGRIIRDANHNAAVLYQFIGIEKLRSHGCRILPLTEAQHLADPEGTDDLRVIVQEENVLALRTADAEIVDGRIIEAAMICHHLEVLMLPLHLLIEGKGFT